MKIEWHQLDRRYEHLRARRPEREKQLVASLAQSGQLVPITVIQASAESSERAAFLVIDGFGRIRALQSLRRDTIEATLLDLPELEALLYHHAQRSSGDETTLEQAWLLAELASRFDLSLSELAHRFAHSTSWVSRRLALVRELPDSIQEWVREGRIGTYAAMRSLVPLARTNGKECEQLAAVIAPLGLTSREIETLVEEWRRSQETVKERILESPRLFLSTIREARRAAEVDAVSKISTSRGSRSRGGDRSGETRDSATHREPETELTDTVSRTLERVVALLQDLDLLAMLATSIRQRWPTESSELDESGIARAQHSLQRAGSHIEWLLSPEAL